MAVTHDDLTTIYSGLEKNFGIKYVPEAVLATTRDGFVLPALCYIVPHLPDSAPDPAFVKQLAQCVRSMGHPEWYAAHVESLSAPVRQIGNHDGFVERATMYRLRLSPCSPSVSFRNRGTTGLAAEPQYKTFHAGCCPTDRARIATPMQFFRTFPSCCIDQT